MSLNGKVGIGQLTTDQVICKSQNNLSLNIPQIKCSRARKHQPNEPQNRLSLKLLPIKVHKRFCVLTWGQHRDIPYLPKQQEEKLKEKPF
jgi:hypothetical protein